MFLSCDDPYFGTGAGTLSAWINIAGMPNADETIFQEGNNGMFCTISSWNSEIYCTNEGSTIAMINTPSFNQWHLFTATRNGSGQYTMYIDGVQQGAANQPGGTPLAATCCGSSIGTDYTNTVSFFDGKIDDVRFYNRALSAAEVAQIYQNPPVGVEGAMMYNSAYHVMQYCDGTNWRQIGWSSH